jgi:chromosome segregation ATPase
MTENFMSVAEAKEVTNADPHTPAVEPPHPDIITMDRKIGTTCASVTLTSGTVVAGDWAAGDCQALRRLVEALVDRTDRATLAVDRVERSNGSLTGGNRELRDQLVMALNEVNDLHLAREHWTEQTGHVGQLMAEITTLKAQLGTAVANTTPEEAALLRQQTQAERARIAEKARADTAEAKVKELTQQLNNTEVGWNTSAHDFIKRHAIDAAMTADQAFVEGTWENAGRLLKLANMWISLLAAADFSKETLPEEPGPSKWP